MLTIVLIKLHISCLCHFRYLHCVKLWLWFIFFFVFNSTSNINQFYWTWSQFNFCWTLYSWSLSFIKDFQIVKTVFRGLNCKNLSKFISPPPPSWTQPNTFSDHYPNNLFILVRSDSLVKNTWLLARSDCYLKNILKQVS